ncbi:hypothetical protein TG4357_01654 [Thalassovita gelatinovora]|uniref:Mitochondrial inner membrane protein n=1 Tax=Thalassovita gelatinovora TaxID=53501 RepID=A0A0P1FVB0_THAGE|nr:hypothetical protein [Thalassovita gelatinovora]QIZ81018.1 hypothetical protein HFZ77_11340 [Thalassovita gelatinovora]CUH65053.1 hypothetical protein TG4357_01654 [Thalassovita gelatinovora]SEP87324.1 Uncharacterized conserved protein [Thalassovita gelatinovora]
MSDPKKSPENSEDHPATIEDAVVVETSEDPEISVSSEDTPQDSATDEGTVGTEETDTPDTDEDETLETSDSTDAQDPDVPETADDPVADEIVENAIADAAPEPVVVRKGGFWPALLGGVIAAGIGAGGALYLFPEGISGSDAVTQLQTQTESSLATQAKRVDDLAAQVDAIKVPPDLSAELTKVSQSVSETTAQLQQLATQISGYEDRLTNLEKRPITEFASKEAVDAYERELQALQAAMAKQRGEIEDMLAAAEAKEASAAQSARTTALRGAVAQLQVALDTGGSFSETLNELEQAGVVVPDILTRLADGAPSLITLQDSFPQAARAALKASRETETRGGAVKFLRDQLGVRSLAPREGGDADAILSRAEAALKAGHLADAMAELQALPEQGRVELTDWMAQATARADALAAAAALRQQVMSN